MIILKILNLNLPLMNVKNAYFSLILPARHLFNTKQITSHIISLAAHLGLDPQTKISNCQEIIFPLNSFLKIVL